jgi:hypothetical protein
MAGDGNGRFQANLSLEQRFLASIDQSGGPEACWPRDSFEDKNGYTRFWLSSDNFMPAHRWAYEHFVEPVGPGLVIDHIASRGCRGGNCVNWIRHLEPVTSRENQLRSKNAKLNEEQALVLYRRWRSGEPQRVLAAEIQMAQASLSTRFKIIAQSQSQDLVK